MEKAKRARKAETPKQPSLCLRLRAPYLYPDPTHSIETPARAGAGKDGAYSAARKGLVLDGSEHDGTLVVVGMTTSEGGCG